VANRKIGIIKGKGGSDSLQKILLSRQAEVFTFELYQRLPTDFITVDGDNLDMMLLHREIDAVIVTSSEAFRYYRDWITQKLPAVLLQNVKKIPLVVNHENIRQLAESSGFNVIVSVGARNQDIISTLYSKVIERDTWDNS
jgi:uroporphyrinogen-III synthase